MRTIRFDLKSAGWFDFGAIDVAERITTFDRAFLDHRLGNEIAALSRFGAETVRVISPGVLRD